MSEFEEQCKYFKAIRERALTDNRYRMISSTQNGAHLKGGAKQYQNLLRAGFSNGFPDTIGLIANKKHHGFAIEFKFGNNKLSPEQERWLLRLKLCGFAICVAYSAEVALEFTDKYWATVSPVFLDTSLLDIDGVFQQ